MPEKRIVRVKRSKIPDTRTRRTKKVHEKQKRAAELRAAGVKYDDIAQELGYANASGAKKAVDSFLARQEMELAKDVVMMDLRRLDEYQMLATHALRQKGDLNQIDRLMRVMEMRYRLLGVSPSTIQQLQEQYGIANGPSIQNNGVMVIQGSTGDFVRQMMEAAGVDPNDPLAQKKMEEIEKRRSQRTPIETPSDGPLPIEGALPALSEEEVVDAEIVDDFSDSLTTHQSD